MQLIAYLNFNGQCKAAFQFYAQCFRGQIVAMSTFGETPAAEHVSADSQNLIIHARLTVGDAVLMGSDCSPDQYEPPKGFGVAIQIEDAAEAERIFHTLADGGTVQMPIEETFWAVRFGMVTDRFGIPWMVNCEKAA